MAQQGAEPVTGRRGGPRLECASCAVGKASMVGQGQMCPFIERRLGAGDVVHHEGAEAHHVWLVRSGTVALTGDRAGPSAGQQVRAIRFPGSFVGLEALVVPTYRDSAVAVTEVSLCGATLSGMDMWLGPPESPARTALELTLKTAATDRPRAASTDGSAVGRLARWLRDEGPRGISLELPRRVVADLLGMRPETLSRSLAELVRRGAIETTRTTLRILDEELLAQAAVT